MTTPGLPHLRVVVQVWVCLRAHVNKFLSQKPHNSGKNCISALSKRVLLSLVIKYHPGKGSLRAFKPPQSFLASLDLAWTNAPQKASQSLAGAVLSLGWPELKSGSHLSSSQGLAQAGLSLGWAGLSLG